MKTRIRLLDKITRKKEIVETFKGTLEELRKRLKELQYGYCENEKPTLCVLLYNNIEILISESDCDFCYCARIK